MKFQSVVVLTAAITSLGLVSSACQVSSPATQSRVYAGPLLTSAEAPPATETLSVQWLNLTVPGLGVMLAAVARPAGIGPFPVVVLLHGSHGFGQQYAELAQNLARGGLIVVAPCWFSGGSGAGLRFITPISCPKAPPMPTASSPQAMKTVEALVQAARALPNARGDRVGLFGHSRGGGATLNYILKIANVQAAVLNSAGYPPEVDQLAAQIRVPILILHGTADSPADGGSAFTDVQMARNFEAALRKAGNSVEAKYYQRGHHNGIFASSAQYNDEVQQMIAFFQRHLSN